MNSRYIPILGAASVSSSNNTTNLGNQHYSVLTTPYHAKHQKNGTHGSFHYSDSLEIRITFERWFSLVCGVLPSSTLAYGVSVSR